MKMYKAIPVPTMRLTAVFAPLSIIMMMASGAAMGADNDLVRAACASGAVTVTAVAPWHANPNAPWAWDKGSLVSKDPSQVRFKGPKCEGSVKAFITNGSMAKGPILIPIK